MQSWRGANGKVRRQSLARTVAGAESAASCDPRGLRHVPLRHGRQCGTRHGQGNGCVADVMWGRSQRDSGTCEDSRSIVGAPLRNQRRSAHLNQTDIPAVRQDVIEGVCIDLIAVFRKSLCGGHAIDIALEVAGDARAGTRHCLS